MTHAQPRWQPGTAARTHPAAAARAPAVQPGRVNGSIARPQPAAPAEIHTGSSIEETQLPDLRLYERLIGDGIAAADARGSAVDHVTARRLAYSVDEAARLTGLSRDLLYDEMRRGNLASVKVGRRRLITRQHLQQFLGIAS